MTVKMRTFRAAALIIAGIATTAFGPVHAAVPSYSAVTVHTYPHNPNAFTEGANDSVEPMKTRPATGQDGSRPKPSQAVARSVSFEAAVSWQIMKNQTTLDG